MGQIENKLKDILEVLKNGGGSGGGGSGELPMITTEDYQESGVTYKKSAVIFPDADYIGDDSKRTPFTIDNDYGGYHLTCRNALFIPQKERHSTNPGGQAVYWWVFPIEIIKNGVIGTIYARKISDSPKKYIFYKKYLDTQVGGSYSEIVDLANLMTWTDIKLPNMRTAAWNGAIPNEYEKVVVTNFNGTLSYTDFETLWNNSGITVDTNGIELVDGSSLLTMMARALSAVKTMASASPSATISKYVPLDVEIGAFVAMAIAQWKRYITNNKKGVYATLGDVIAPLLDINAPDGGQSADYFATFQLKECDFANNKLYETKITLNAQKVYFQCTCHEATSLM